MESTVTLESVFSFFTHGNVQMNNIEFDEINNECGLYDQTYTTTDCDMNFILIKSTYSNSITFDQFCECIKLAAAKKGIDYDSIVNIIITNGAPKIKSTIN